MDTFFADWDLLERINPWGVQFLGPFFSVNGVSLAACEEVDARLFIDLMDPVFPDIRRIKVEGRFTGHVFWVHILLRYPFAIVSFQRLPNAPFERSLPVVATPRSVVACILAFNRWMLGSGVGRRCFSRRNLLPDLSRSF
jgi:hypothetical protein